MMWTYSIILWAIILVASAFTIKETLIAHSNPYFAANVPSLLTPSYPNSLC